MTILTSPDLDALAPALALAQAQVTSAKRTETNPFFRSKYADLSEVWDSCRHALTANGLSVVQCLTSTSESWLIPRPVKNKAGDVTGTEDVPYIWVSLNTRLLHSSAQWMEGTISLPVEADPQAIGRATTYLRRYALMSMVGIAAEDDDGEDARQRREATVGARPTPSASPSDPSHFCAEHQTPWTKRTGRNGAAWWSHAIPSGGWCNMPSIQGVDDQADAADVPETAPGSPATPAQAPTAAKAAVLPEPPEIKNLGGLLTYGMALGMRSKAACLIAMGMKTETQIADYTEAAQTMYQFALRRATSLPVTP